MDQKLFFDVLWLEALVLLALLRLVRNSLSVSSDAIILSNDQMLGMCVILDENRESSASGTEFKGQELFFDVLSEAQVLLALLRLLRKSLFMCWAAIILCSDQMLGTCVFCGALSRLRDRLLLVVACLERLAS